MLFKIHCIVQRYKQLNEMIPFPRHPQSQICQNYASLRQSQYESQTVSTYFGTKIHIFGETSLDLITFYAVMCENPWGKEIQLHYMAKDTFLHF